MLEITEIAGINESQRPCPKSQDEKGGRAAVIPLREVNPPPPEGSEREQSGLACRFRFLFLVFVEVFLTLFRER